MLNNLIPIQKLTRDTFKPYFKHPKEPKEKILSERGTYHPRNTLNHMTGKEWIHFSRSWFNHKSKPRNKDKGEDLHPAKFPEGLIERFIKFFTKKGAWVLDPFCGTASTLVAAEKCKRNAIGIELSKKWAKLGAKRTKQYIILGDSRGIKDLDLPPIDFSITSPPYWDMLKHSRGGSESTQKDRIFKGYDAYFSDLKKDLGNIEDYYDFLDNLMEIYKNILEKMRPVTKKHPGGYCVVILQNIQKENRELYPLAWEFALKMRKIGWNLRQEMIWCQSDKKLGIWGYPNTYISNVHHHYCLVFQA
ncbi:MAG: DNA methyltransferase [Promethearchaeota archaeon]